LISERNYLSQSPPESTFLSETA